MHPPNMQEWNYKFRRIGAGFCGSVWSREGSRTALKREDGGPGRSLVNDYNMHRLVLETATRQKISVCVPRRPHFIKNDDHTWWDLHLARFPTGYTSCNVLCAERIPPLPRDVRNRLIDRYCPSTLNATIKNNDPDRDCLVRLYLGRRKIQNEARPGRNFFSLRNYPLHLNQAESLQLPILEYAKAMAEMLAMMHWTARIDANDVEFVLGGVPAQPEPGHSRYTHPILGPHCLWVLDFDCCKPMTMDDAGIEQAARAFLRNDPYFPRPAISPQHPDNVFWMVFRNRYLEYSQRLVAGHDIAGLNLPEKFIARVAEIHEQITEHREKTFYP
ncbi:hypothetical protein LTS07_005993 [Exophiala sideris]|uniref:DUF3669 domain-containing protein n=1 Tax=Exophiala sideris TaxID=1016849 RepID=A0ABR0J858_9EURO|nr:hypothetical protein LTS07_005993 [Exophiala sideris]KAK5058160.1 hypothetical protein LTR69_007157 [Exophiala sideris]KAK5182120.1 hypothetical protein LTR44_005721 [Eurotiomycetes sp. CCFEE 6388]